MIALALSIVLLGNSITRGAVSAPIGPSYDELLALEYNVTNLGRGGATTRDWDPAGTFLYPDVPLHLPAVVTILLGTNDATGFFEPSPVEPDEYAERMAELVAALLADGAERVILLTAPQNFAAFLNFEAHRRLRGYRLAVGSLCEPPGDNIDCGPDLHALMGPEDFAEGTDVHPNAQGHAFIAEQLAIVIPEPAAPIVALLVLAFLRRK